MSISEESAWLGSADREPLPGDVPSSGARLTFAECASSAAKPTLDVCGPAGSVLQPHAGLPRHVPPAIEGPELWLSRGDAEPSLLPEGEPPRPEGGAPPKQSSAQQPPESEQSRPEEPLSRRSVVRSRLRKRPQPAEGAKSSSNEGKLPLSSVKPYCDAVPASKLLAAQPQPDAKPTPDDEDKSWQTVEGAI